MGGNGEEKRVRTVRVSGELCLPGAEPDEASHSAVEWIRWIDPFDDRGKKRAQATGSEGVVR